MEQPADSSKSKEKKEDIIVINAFRDPGYRDMIRHRRDWSRALRNKCPWNGLKRMSKHAKKGLSHYDIIRFIIVRDQRALKCRVPSSQKRPATWFLFLIFACDKARAVATRYKVPRLVSRRVSRFQIESSCRQIGLQSRKRGNNRRGGPNSKQKMEVVKTKATRNPLDPNLRHDMNLKILLATKPREVSLCSSDDTIRDLFFPSSKREKFRTMPVASR